MSLMPDPSFYPSPRMAMQAPPEHLAYVALLNVESNAKCDAMAVIDLDSSSSKYGRVVGQVDFPRGDNELHHFGWNVIGKDIERDFTISGGQLTITFNTTTREGVKVTRTLIWQRMK